MHTSAHDKGRIEAIDLARGAAIVAMVIYHFAWDLEFFGYVEAGTINQGGWRVFARSIASSFLFLVGVSLYLAHARAIRWRPFAKRFAMVFGAALAISLVTYLAVPDAFIFFGILHHIAIASLFGLAFLRLPAWLIILCALFAIAAPHFLRAEIFAHAGAWWIGLSPTNPRSNDFVPLFPWFGAVLFGIAGAKIAHNAGWIERLGRWRAWQWTGTVQTAGRHSLVIYLVHQPVLVALIWLFAQVVPPQPAIGDAAFRSACAEQCQQHGQPEEFCQAYCGCVSERLVAEHAAGHSVEQDSERLQAITMQCSMQVTDPPQQQEDAQ